MDDLTQVAPWIAGALAGAWVVSLALPIVGRLVTPWAPRLGPALERAGNDLGGAVRALRGPTDPGPSIPPPPGSNGVDEP